ncbi:MAG: nucleotidyl transferase AbiEii/AbiGii toxin family protein [Vicinamibacteria bacterium]
MKAIEFWKTIAVDHANFLDEFIAVLRDEHISFCVVGGQAVNAYVEPLVSLDLDLVIAVDQLALIDGILGKRFRLARFPHSLNISVPRSNLRIQIQTDPRYFPFVERAAPKDVLGLSLPVASIEDVLQGKVWAVSDPTRRASKRQKDLADISRILEAYPEHRREIPEEILSRLL